MEMQYRRLGRSGIKVSALSFGSWVTFGPQLDLDQALSCMTEARDAGVNFFDNAEVYAGGESERLMGKAFRELGWDRRDYLVTSKFFWGIHEGVNTRNTLNRVYLLDAVDRCLERFGLDHVDVAYCHRSDPETPIEETVWTMSDIVASGRARYWGTSEWSADEIRSAIEIAEKHHLRAPITEQPQYNLFHRARVEVEYQPLFKDFGYGTTIWSPLASGLLTGKYKDGIPEGSRGSLPGYSWLGKAVSDEGKNKKVAALEPIAKELGCTLAQMSIAWCLLNENVSTVITGASSAAQVRENMHAMEVVSSITPDVAARIEKTVA